MVKVRPYSQYDYVKIIPSEEEGNALRKQYLQNKLGWLYDDGNPVEPLTSEEKKLLKLFLEDQVEYRLKVICNRLVMKVKKIRSKNPQRNSIDDLLDLRGMFSDHSSEHSSLVFTLLSHIQGHVEGYDVSEGIQKEQYKVRKSWGGVK